MCACTCAQVRLREVVEDLLGPLRWSPATHQPTQHTSSAGRHHQRGWQPSILGIDKRQLLRQDVLKEMSRNRANQRLVQEVGTVVFVCSLAWPG